MEIENVIVCIPVHRIDKRMKTLQKLNDEGSKYKIAIFCDEGQKRFFEEKLDKVKRCKVFECKGAPTRWQKRQIILDFVKRHNYKYMITLDDDLSKVIKRDSIKELSSELDELSIDLLFDVLITLLEKGADISSTVSQFAYLHGKNNVVNMRRPSPISAYNIQRIKEEANDVKYREVEAEDICFWYELVERGLIIQIVSNIQTAFNYTKEVVDKTIPRKERKSQNDLLQEDVDKLGLDLDVKEVVSYMRNYKPKWRRVKEIEDMLKE